MNLGEALVELQAGKMVSRTGWNAHHKLGLQMVDGKESNTQPYVFMVTAQGARIPWVCSQTDLLATDWVVEQ